MNETYIFYYHYIGSEISTTIFITINKLVYIYFIISKVFDDFVQNNQF
jgi:hypothetical protein